MKARLTTKMQQQQRLTWKRTVAVFSILITVSGGAALIYFNLGYSMQSKAARPETVNVPSGAWAIGFEENQGNPAVVGMMQDLLQSSNVPLVWCPMAAGYPKGVLLLESRYASPLVAYKLETWQQAGVKMAQTGNDFSAGTYKKINCFPLWSIDTTLYEPTSWEEYLAASRLPDYAVSYNSGDTHEEASFDATAKSTSANKHQYKNILTGFLTACVSISGESKINEVHQNDIRLTYSIDRNTEGWTYQWSSTLGGRFSDPNSPATAYIVPKRVKNDTIDLVRMRATDVNGTVRFACHFVTLKKSDKTDIGLMNFSGHMGAEGMLLKWGTVQEVNNDYFSLERSADGNEWSSVARQPGAGTSQEIRNYHITDQQPIKGRSFYRLSQTGFDGRKNIVQVISADNYTDLDESNVLPVENSVFTQALTFHVQSENVGQGKLKIYGTDGELKDACTYPLSKGKQVLTYSRSELPAGTYIAVFQLGEGETMSTRIVKI